MLRYIANLWEKEALGNKNTETGHMEINGRTRLTTNIKLLTI